MQHFSDTCMYWQERNLVWMEKLVYHIIILLLWNAQLPFASKVYVV